MLALQIFLQLVGIHDLSTDEFAGSVNGNRGLSD
jgi:hypothetical protein